MTMRYRILEGYKYLLLCEVKYPVALPDTKQDSFNNSYGFLNIRDGMLTIQKHYAWDGPSGPTFDTKTFMRGSLIHDALYQLIREGVLDKKYREQADRILKAICLYSGMNKFRAWYVYHSVRLFGGGGIKPRKKPRGQIIEI